jgi:hypothetical protein
LLASSWTHAQPPSQASKSDAEIQIIVRSDSGPIARAQVIARGRTFETDAEGRATIHVRPGPLEITVVKEGFDPVTASTTAAMGAPQVIPIVLERQTAIEEHVTVSATRTDKRIEDQPMRVEVLDAEEIEEKQRMTPCDIVMMLNEMGGLRVQATSPSLGAASVRVQGMRGRYTRLRRVSRALTDGRALPGVARRDTSRRGTDCPNACGRALRADRARLGDAQRRGLPARPLDGRQPQDRTGTNRR